MLKHIRTSKANAQKGAGANGFTLIELLIVIVILGVLALVVVFSVRGITDTGEDAACETDARTLRTALEAYRAETGAYGTEAQLVSAGFLAKASTQHDVSGNSITGPCA